MTQASEKATPSPMPIAVYAFALSAFALGFTEFGPVAAGAEPGIGV